MSKPTVICLTPVRNEIWILDRFLKCASLWADHIIIVDQNSDDGSRELALNHPKVILLDYVLSSFNEMERRKLLVETARRIPGPRLLISIDADEMLTANFLESPEWNSVLQASPGTLIRFQWVFLHSDMRSYWMADPHDQAWGFMDDGATEFEGKPIHGPRMVIPPYVPSIVLRDIKVMHYYAVYPAKVEAKRRWYQCWARLNDPDRRPIDLYRFYSYAKPLPGDIKPLPLEWLCGYQRHGIDMTSIYREGIFHMDRQVLDYLIKYGPEKFRRVTIWDVDWNALHRKVYPDAPAIRLDDPRNKFERFVHRWLEETQPYFARGQRKPTLAIRLIQQMLRLLGW